MLKRIICGNPEIIIIGVMCVVLLGYLGAGAAMQIAPLDQDAVFWEIANYVNAFTHIFSSGS